MSDNHFTWKEFVGTWKQVPSNLYNTGIAIWATPLWWKITTIIHLVTLFGGMYFSLSSMIIWMDNLNVGGEYEYEAWHELIFWGWMFGTIAGMFIYWTIFERISTKILIFLNYIEEGEKD